MTINSIELWPNTKFKNAGLSAAVKDITFLNGKVYGITFTGGGGSTQMSVTPLYGTSTPATLSAALVNAKSITNDGTYLYAVEERTGAASAATNAIAQITTAGVLTKLSSTFLNMRSVVYDDTNKCLYVSCPFDNKIVKVTGGSIGGDTSGFATTDFITGITNQPGRLALNEGGTALYFTTESNVKQIGASTLVAGVAQPVVYYNLNASPTEETTLFLYFEVFDTFLFAGTTNDRGALIGLDLFSQPAWIPATTALVNGQVLDNQAFIIPDGTSLTYLDIGGTFMQMESSTIAGGSGASAASPYKILGGWQFTETAGSTARVKLLNGVGGAVMLDVKLASGESAGDQFNFMLRADLGFYVSITSGTVQATVYGR